MSDTEYGACVVLIPSETGLPDEVVGGHHITLAYFGDQPLEGMLEVELLRIVGSMMDNAADSILIHPDTIDHFGEDGDAVVVTFDKERNDVIFDLRNQLINEFSAELQHVFNKAQTFPEYKPHMTLGYISEGYEDRFLDLPPVINIEGISVWNGTSRVFVRNRNDVSVAHYGIARKSGRYPWGSGQNPYQRSVAFYKAYNQLKAEGLSEKDIARVFGEQSTLDDPSKFNTAALRRTRSQARDEKRAGDRAMAIKLREKGWSHQKIGERLDMPSRTVGALLQDSVEEKVNITKQVTDMIRTELDSGTYVDVGKGVENQIGVSSDRLKTAIAILREEGYELKHVPVTQLGMANGNETTVKVMVQPGTKFPEVLKNTENIKPLGFHSDDNGRTFTKPDLPRSISSKKIDVVYSEDGGTDRDGLIEIRPGAEGLDLGHNKYGQVRIAVDDTHYIKGMAIYSDDLPKGKDIRFNTNKSRADAPKTTDVLKELKLGSDGKVDPDAPFGAMIKPGGQRGYLNMVNEEGDWDKWSKKLSSQMLSKQNQNLAKQQLKLTVDAKKDELATITSLTNPTVKKRLLQSFADDVDSQAVTLKAMGLPRTHNKVILPFPEIKETEIYAPTYKNGERVVLIRHPHGGVFEIPELVVNNRNKTAKTKIGNAVDAVGIHPNVAEQLSGADFDGDTVLVIPQKPGSQKIKISKPLEGLKNFDPKITYKGYPGMKVMSNTQRQMGEISNLITDMTIGGANESELAAAVRHSMVVIDAEKHKLNYKQSFIDNGIARLKKEYQPKGGASTIISRAKSRVDVLEYKPRPAKDGGPIDKKTGELKYVLTNNGYDKQYIDKSTGEVLTKFVPKRTKSMAMKETTDAHSLVSSTKGTPPIERIYADHANAMKGLANEARRVMVNTEEPRASRTASLAYEKEVASLNAKLNTALKNAPLERQAQIVGNAIVSAKLANRPDMDSDELKKVRTRALEEARLRTGAKKQQVSITPKEWEAIQAHAISPTKLGEILRHADLDRVKELATPRDSIGVAPAVLSRARAMLDRGYTQAEVAEALGISTSTLTKALRD